MAEYRDILATGRLREGAGSLEGKWFADSLQGARSHGDSFYPDGSYGVIEVEVPDDAPSLFRLSNLDGLGPARYLNMDDLQGAVPRPLELPR